MKQANISQELQRRGVHPRGVHVQGADLTQIRYERYDFAELIDLLGSDVDDQRISEAAFAAAFPAPLEQVARSIAGARKLLHDAGLPSTNEFVEVHADGSWAPFESTSDSWMERAAHERKHLVRGLAYSAQLSRPESNIWFAATLIDIINQMVSKINANDATRAASLGILTGRLLERYWFKFHHEKPAMRGHASDAGRRRAHPRGTEVTKERGDRRYRAIVRAARELRERDPALVDNTSETARRIEAQRLPALRQRHNTFVGVDTIRKAIASAVKRGDLR